MKKRWILIALSVGLLAAAITGGVALAWGGPGHGWGRGDHDEHKTAVAAKVAGILGTDAEETTDAIAQANREVREEVQEAALQDFAGRVATTLGAEAQATADALTQVSEAMRSEALESKLQAAIDNGDMTEEEAQEIRDKVASNEWRAEGFLFKGGNSQEFANQVGAILEVTGDDTAAAIQQALSDIRSEGLESRLQAAIDSGQITEDKAAEIHEKFESGEWNGFGKRGHRGNHANKGFGRRGHHGGNGAHDDSSTGN